MFASMGRCNEVSRFLASKPCANQQTWPGQTIALLPAFLYNLPNYKPQSTIYNVPQKSTIYPSKSANLDWALEITQANDRFFPAFPRIYQTTNYNLPSTPVITSRETPYHFLSELPNIYHFCPKVRLVFGSPVVDPPLNERLDRSLARVGQGTRAHKTGGSRAYPEVESVEETGKR